MTAYYDKGGLCFFINFEVYLNTFKQTLKKINRTALNDMLFEMSVQFDLEILHHILNQFSENVARDCSRIIERLLKDLTDSTANDLIKFQDKKTFAVVEVLLYLYEKLQQDSENEFHESKPPVHLIIHSIQHLQQCSEKNCKLPDKDVQCNILSIISLMYKNALVQNNVENLEDLVKFYDCILMSIYKRDDNKECKSDCWIFKLKIINSVYHALNSFAPNNVEFQERLKLINNLDECKLFGDLVLYQNDDIAIQTLMCLIPEYIKCFKNGEVVKVIWKLISDSITDSSVNYCRVLTVLCKVFDFCFEKSTLKDIVDVTTILLEDSNYWKLVQLALVEEDSLKRKKGFYLFKKTIHLLNSTNKNIECSKEHIFFYWNTSCKDELYKIYSEIIIILEFLEEQQVHIVKPIFGMTETLAKKIIKCNKVSFTWILLIYKKSLMHESTQIVKWGLSSLLELSEDFFSNEYVIKEIVELLIVTLSDMNLYYNDNWDITRELKQFFDKIINLRTSKTFFNLFIKCLCHQVWSAETLFFVIYSMSDIENHDKKSFWGQEEIYEIKEFVSKAFKTHNKIIRTGVQCELLRAISHLTDCRKVPLENLILLISRFSIGEVLPFGTPAMNTFIKWLWNSYPEKEFKNVIERYKRGELEKEFNEKCISLIFILFYQVSKDADDGAFKMNYLKDMLLSFKEIDKRLYCNKTLQNQYLSVIIHIYEANVNNCISGLVKYTLTFVSDIVIYILSQLQQISGLQDFSACQFYLNAFVNIIKALILLEANKEYVTDLYIKLLKDLEVACIKSDIPSIELYYKMKLLSIILELYPLEPKSSFLDSYLLMKVNEPLKKDSDYSAQTRDSQTLWGRMNSEFLEGKWRILEFLINKKIIICEPSVDQPVKVEKAAWISYDDLVVLCSNALITGGYGVLCPVMSILKDLLPTLKNALEMRKIVESVWKVISERRKTEEFKLFIKHFVEMLFQEALILMGDFAQDILLEYADFIYSDSSLAVVNIFIKHIQQINISDTSVTLFSHVIGKGLLFGPVQKKDENLTNRVCDRIKFLKICEVSQIGDFSLSQEIRARAVQKILMLDKTCETHKIAARSLICTLLKMESEINKNRVRYFGDSHTHRVKHRLMQALLLLEPLLEPNENQAIKLSEWLLQCLVSENSQPSVRYMQEWLLVRMMVRHSELYTRVSASKYCLNDEEINKKSLCSFIAITFHICRLIPSDIMEERILSELCGILSLCFHQHFEVRLYAQVVFMKLYNFSKSRKLVGVIKQFEYFYRILDDIFLNARKGNFSKNLLKLTEDFYLTTFEPLEHYSLETIYMDLPRLTNTSSDERISTEVFQNCGIDSYNRGIPLRTENSSLKYVNETERFMKKLHSDISTASDDPKADEILGNYQKKIIPMKPLIPVWDENDLDQKCYSKKGGLVVVASLIDRIPNLGGLARTCEIFGASEYVVNSLKYTEDKQFTSLSVTAEKWIPVKEVRSQNLLDYILEMKQTGYTVIGAEQALFSVPLSAVKFPKKSLLLLGNEKEGIPPNLLPLLDICVEIPQVGIIRSLNVHVTGALFIWEYAKQNLFS